MPADITETQHRQCNGNLRADSKLRRPEHEYGAPLSDPIFLTNADYPQTGLVKPTVEAIEPFHGLDYDQACGSDRMFMQASRSFERHREDPTNEIRVHGQKQSAETASLVLIDLDVSAPGMCRPGLEPVEDPETAGVA